MLNRLIVRAAAIGLFTASSASAATISGAVKRLDAQGNLVPAPAEVTVTDTNGGTWTTFTAQNGSYSLAVPPGIYSLVAVGTVLPFTEDCDHLLQLSSPSSSDTCLVIVQP